MRKLILAGLIGATLLTGCAQRYTITLNTGNRINTKGKPKLRGTTYYYKDLAGNPGTVSKMRVRELSPTSMSSPSSSSGFKAEPKK